MDEIELNWNKNYNIVYQIVLETPPTNYITTTQGVAYWQWAMAFMTITKDANSVTKIVDTVTGYPEISFFKSDLFDKSVNANYLELFKGVNLYNDPRDKTKSSNYEALFNLTDAKGSAPGA